MRGPLLLAAASMFLPVQLVNGQSAGAGPTFDLYDGIRESSPIPPGDEAEAIGGVARGSGSEEAIAKARKALMSRPKRGAREEQSAPMVGPATVAPTAPSRGDGESSEKGEMPVRRIESDPTLSEY